MTPHGVTEHNSISPAQHARVHGPGSGGLSTSSFLPHPLRLEPQRGSVSSKPYPLSTCDCAFVFLTANAVSSASLANPYT